MSASTKTTLTDLQRATLKRVHAAQREGRWYRAGATGEQSSGGERVTLASLYYRRILTRRAWRVGKGARDSAYEYRVDSHVLELLEKPTAVRS